MKFIEPSLASKSCHLKTGVILVHDNKITTEEHNFIQTFIYLYVNIVEKLSGIKHRYMTTECSITDKNNA